MKISRLAGIAALLAAGFTQAQAQDVKVNILTEFWYTQMLDSNLRNNSIQNQTSNYYALDSRFQENTFNVKRAEIYCNYKISDEWAGYVMFDPSLTNTSAAAASATTASGSALQDWVITWTPSSTGLTVKAGQFKMPTTYESTILSARDIYFFDRAQISRIHGEKRDRGVWFAYGYGKADGFKGNVNVAISNGTTDDGTSGKTAVDQNAQKDYTFRFDGSFGSAHRFGAYYREGETNLKTSTLVAATLPANWTAAGINQQALLDNRDKTTLEGAFYAFNTDTWHFDAEFATGLIGRRFPTLFAAAAAPSRQHLDQKFQTYEVTAVYKMGRHQIGARYDMFNYNSGNDFYGAVNPYMATSGANAGGDFSPKYTETTVGYNYLFTSKYTYGKMKLDYIHRSKNFLNSLATAGQTGAQGGDSVVASFMVGF
jgi:hypothetical protein